MQNKVELGKYKHYRGKEYEVISIGLNELDETPVVIYKTLYDNEKSSVWVRPVESFLEIVKTEVGEVPRFTKIEDEKEDV